MTGKRKQVMRAEKEQISCFKEELSIIDKETWEKAQRRWVEMEGAWPMSKQSEKTSQPQKSYIYSNPTHALAGLIKCRCCDGAMVQVSGKGGGYYGCYNAKRKSCTNKLLVPRKRIEAIILNDLKEKFLTAENLKYIYENVEKAIAKTLNEVPEDLKQKRTSIRQGSSGTPKLAEFHQGRQFLKSCL